MRRFIEKSAIFAYAVPASLVFNLYVSNAHFVPISEIFPSLFWSVLVTFLIILVSKIAFKNIDQKKVNIYIVLTLIIIFYQYVLHENLRSQIAYISPQISNYTWIFLTLIVILNFIGINLIQKKKLDKIHNFISISLIIFVSIFSFKLYQTKDIHSMNRASITNDLENLQIAVSENSPNIYFLVFDRYANKDSLQNYYNYDNTEFLNKLEDKNFTVVDKSYANYLKTSHSLTATLNMSYINNLSEVLGEKSKKTQTLYELIEDNLVQEILQDNGYKFYHLGSWWTATRENDNADYNYNHSLMSEFSYNLYVNTLFEPPLRITGIYNAYRESWERVNLKFEELEQISNYDHKKYVFAHFLVPHPPYIFNAEGEFLKDQDLLTKTNAQKYIDQLIFTNSRILQLVDNIQKNDPNSIILIQADEGPFPDEYEENEVSFDWSSATQDQINEKMGILNAYYFPNLENPIKINTPVNNFRYIFNEYFGTDLELLEDKSYLHKNNLSPFEFIDVTNILLN